MRKSMGGKARAVEMIHFQVHSSSSAGAYSLFPINF